MSEPRNDLVTRLLMAQISACACMTKSPEASYHRIDCLYRILADAVAYIQRAPEPAEHHEQALARIFQWADAYPLDVFPEPDFKKARKVLQAAGITLDAISASNMRHVITQVKHIALDALGHEPRQRNPVRDH